MSTKSVIAFLFLASSVWSGPQVATGAEVPFKGSLKGETTITPLTPPLALVHFQGTGDATQLGKFTIDMPHTVNFATGTAVGTLVFTAANGDTLTADFTGVSGPSDVSDFFQVEETAFITGGTGRFAGATGSFIIKRLIHSVTFSSTGSFEGKISSPVAKPTAGLSN